jgi:hypothetical protein
MTRVVKEQFTNEISELLRKDLPHKPRPRNRSKAGRGHRLCAKPAGRRLFQALNAEVASFALFNANRAKEVTGFGRRLYVENYYRFAAFRRKSVKRNY